MSNSKGIVRAVQGTAIFLTAAAAGANLGFSIFTTPRLLESPVPTMLVQWKRMYISGRNVMVTTGVFASLAHLVVFLAARRGVVATNPKLALAATVLSASFMPYTPLVLLPTNNKLLKKTEEVEKAEASGKASSEISVSAAEEKSARYLVDHWGLLNLGRSALLAAGATVALVAAL